MESATNASDDQPTPLTIPLECFYGCPDAGFRELCHDASAIDADVAAAEGAGVSSVGLNALRAAADQMRAKAMSGLGEIPEGAPGPWQPSDADIAAHPRLPLRGRVTCCRLAGVTFVGFPGYDMKSVNVRNPAIPPAADRGGESNQVVLS